MEPSLKDLLNAPDEASAVVLVTSTEARADLLNGDYAREDEEGEELPPDEEALQMMTKLTETDRLLINRFRNVEWLKGILSTPSQHPHSPLYDPHNIRQSTI